MSFLKYSNLQLNRAISTVSTAVSFVYYFQIPSGFFFLVQIRAFVI